MAINASVGARVGDYILVKKLGEGGMAEVWAAQHFTSGQVRALKFLNRQFQGIPEVEARFQAEGENRLVHPHIVRIHHSGFEAGRSYLVMDFIDGRDLEKILDSRRGPLTVPEAVDIAMQVLSGLGFAHTSGIIHRDIKPSNVLVDYENQAYLMDFGIAKAIHASRSVTQVGSKLGTPDYMSPEQIRNPRDVDRRSDIYSFGCLFYELLTGWPPFDRGSGYQTEQDIRDAHCAHQPIPPAERKGNLPTELNDIVMHCLAKLQADRPQSCEEILTALDTYRASVTRTANPGRSNASSSQGIELPKVPTGPGETVRRETLVIPSGSQPAEASPWTSVSPGNPSGPGIHGSGLSNIAVSQGRTPTIADDSPLGLNTAGTATEDRQQDQQNRKLPPVPTHFVSTTETTKQFTNDQKPAQKGLPKLLTAVGSLLLVVALGGGAWLYFHKEPVPKPQPGLDTTGSNTSGTNTAGAGTSGTGSSGAGTQAAQLGTHSGAIPGQGTNAPLHPSSNVPNPVQGNHGGETNNRLPIQEHTRPPVQLPQVSDHPAPQTAPLTGTLSWTGDPSSVGKHVTIIRSESTALQGGQVTGTMFPAGPVKITLRSGVATIIPPNAQTNYNSLDLFLPNPGTQTIVLQWTAQSNPQ
jgi:serine/threonine protein kinase